MTVTETRCLTMSFQPDYDDLVRLYKKFEATGKVPDRLYDFVY